MNEVNEDTIIFHKGDIEQAIPVDFADSVRYFTPPLMMEQVYRLYIGGYGYEDDEVECWMSERFWLSEEAALAAKDSVEWFDTSLSDVVKVRTESHFVTNAHGKYLYAEDFTVAYLRQRFVTRFHANNPKTLTYIQYHIDKIKGWLTYLGKPEIYAYLFEGPLRIVLVKKDTTIKLGSLPGSGSWVDKDGNPVVTRKLSS